MTTIAWDGKTIAADTLEVDGWGLKSECRSKLLIGSDFVCGGAGGVGQIMRWFNNVKDKSHVELLSEGYKPYEEGKDTPSIILLCEKGAFKLEGGFFCEIGRGYHALGSGRDYAIAAMHIGMSAHDAVKLASELDNSTGGKITVVEINYGKQDSHP